MELCHPASQHPTAVSRKSLVATFITLRLLSTKNITPEIQADITELRRLLHLNSEATEFELTSAPLPSGDTEIAVQTRSVIELMKDMAAQVEIPTQDQLEHKAFPGFGVGHDVPGVTRIIRIRSAKQKPNDAFIT